MTRPTDDELEAMAVRLEAMPRPSMIDALKFCPHEAAAMLRACKGRVKPLPRGDGDGGWTLPVELLSDLEREVIADGWDGCTAEVTEIIALSVERRILAALEPAPDHAEWDAALEAAAKKCETHGVLGGPVENPYAEWKTHADNLAAAIRTLKKGSEQ